MTEEHVLDIDTRDFVLQRALNLLREVVWEGRYEIKSHAQQHARAEGFFEKDIVYVLETGKVRAIYPRERRWLVMGYFRVADLRLPLHVVVEFQSKRHFVDVVTAYIPKNPHQIVSRQRLALMLRHDQTEIRGKVAKPGQLGRKRWHKHWR